MIADGRSEGPEVEWARVASDEIIIANANRAWLHRPDAFAPDDPFAVPMTGPGRLETTRQLLEGAIGAGLRAARRAADPGPPPPKLTAERWAWRLCGLYHMTTHTPSLLAEAEVKFTAHGRPILAAWAADRRREESGHDLLALRDLKALGLPADIVERVHPPGSASMVSWFRDAVRSADLPLGAVAYAHTVERLALRFGRAYLDRVRAVLPPGIDATRCLRVHSAVGADVSHVDDNITVIAGLPAADRVACVLACRQIARLSSTPPTGGYRDQASLVSFFGELGRHERAQPEGESHEG